MAGRKNMKILAAINALGNLEEAAKKTGLSIGTLSGMVNRRHSSTLRSYEKLAKAAKLRIADLLEEPEEKPVSQHD